MASTLRAVPVAALACALLVAGLPAAAAEDAGFQPSAVSKDNGAFVTPADATGTDAAPGDAQATRTLQQLIDATPRGGVLEVPARVFKENVVITKAITLVARPGASLEQPDRAATAVANAPPLLRVDSAVVHIRGLSFGQAPVAIAAKNAHVLVDGVAFDDPGVAVAATGGALALVIDSKSTGALQVRADADSRAYLGRSTVVRLLDADTGARIDGGAVTLEDDRGLEVWRWEAPAGGDIRMGAPVPPDGTAIDATVTFAAPSYDARRVTAQEMADGLATHAGGPVEIPLAAATPTGTPAPEPASPPDAADPRPATDLAAEAVPAPEPEPALSRGAVFTLAAGTATVGAAAVGARLLVQDETRLWRYLLAGLPLYTRLTRTKLLDQPTRERVYRFIQEHPGSHYRLLRRALNLTNGALTHHIDVLTREGFIRAERHGQYLRFFVTGEKHIAAPLDTTERVLAFVRDNPGTTGAEVARGLEATPSLVAYHIDRLEQCGRVARTRTGRHVRLYSLDGASTGGAAPS